ncbi:MAG: rhodanese-like domain-containing protein, partial [Candidatus Omnitrophica bacterium]|nr:rhodanese-like domain-containing protein [Candidatus Omnitrophota bacterium]
MIKEINTDQLLKMVYSVPRLKIVDVLPAESFEKEHIKGAISLPLDDIESSAEGILKKDDQIITYCASSHCPA